MVANTTVDWITKEITIQRSDLPISQVSPERRTLDTVALHEKLRELHASEEGRPWEITHTWVGEITQGNITFAPKFNILAPYFVTIEDGQYGVLDEGSDNNILDVKTDNQVSYLTTASAGTTVPPLTLDSDIEDGETLIQTLRIIRAAVAGVSTFVGGTWRFFSRSGSKARITADVNTGTQERDTVATDGSD